MITIYFVAYNEEVRLQFMLDHYKSRFPTAKFVLYDNESTDNTVSIALKNGCEIISYKTNNEVNDELLMQLKNNCWKSAQTDWVLVCDPDELFDLNENDIRYEESIGTTIIKATAYNMVNMEDNLNLQEIKYGARSIAHDKCFVFNKKHIVDINFNHGCHVASPTGIIKYNTNIYNMYHYHFINIDYVYNRYEMTVKRFSEINKRHGWGIHCTKTRSELTNRFNDLKRDAIKIRF